MKYFNKYCSVALELKPGRLPQLKKKMNSKKK